MHAGQQADHLSAIVAMFLHVGNSVASKEESQNRWCQLNANPSILALTQMGKISLSLQANCYPASFQALARTDLRHLHWLTAINTFCTSMK